MSDPRLTMLGRLEKDLIGPGEIEESIRDKPSDRYLTGILYAQRQEMSADEDERLEVTATESEDDEGTSGIEDQVPTSFMKKPSACGVSFRCEAEEPAFDIRIA